MKEDWNKKIVICLDVLKNSIQSFVLGFHQRSTMCFFISIELSINKNIVNSPYNS
jgi:hypothetical protein